MPPGGRAGFFCQSGALGSAILEKVNNRGLGLSTFVSAGNRADVSGNDLLQYWEEDDATEVVLLYLESIGNPRKFSRIARRVSLRKPIIAVRSGRTTQGVPMGHAVRKIVAPQQAVDAMFRQAGVIQVDTLDEMFDVAQLLAHQPLPRGRRVAVVGNSDALGLLAADAAAAVGLVVNKSVALGADATAEDFEDALDARDRRPRRRRRRRGLHPAAQRLRRGRRQRARRGGGAVRQAAGLVVPRRRGRARAAAGPRRRRAARPGAARCRPTPRSRPPCARWPGSSGTPCGCAPPTAPLSTRRTSTSAGARSDRQRRRSATTRTGSSSTTSRSTRLLAAYGIDVLDRAAGQPTSRRPRRPGASSAGTSSSRRPPATCGSGPTSPTCGATSTPPPRCGRLGVAARADHRARTTRASWSRRTPRRACRWRSAASRTRCSARSSRSASPGR